MQVMVSKSVFVSLNILPLLLQLYSANIPNQFDKGPALWNPMLDHPKSSDKKNSTCGGLVPIIDDTIVTPRPNSMIIWPLTESHLIAAVATIKKCSPPLYPGGGYFSRMEAGL